MENEQSKIEAEERRLALYERAKVDSGGNDARIARLAEVYAVRKGRDLATAIAAFQRGDGKVIESIEQATARRFDPPREGGDGARCRRRSWKRAEVASAQRVGAP